MSPERRRKKNVNFFEGEPQRMLQYLYAGIYMRAHSVWRGRKDFLLDLLLVA